MQEDEKNNIIPLLFVALLAGTFLLFSELQVGDLVRVSGYGLEPNAVGVHTPVSITTRGEVVLLEHGS